MTDFADTLALDRGQDARTIRIVEEGKVEAWKADLSPRARASVDASPSFGKAGSLVILPGQDAEEWSVAFVASEDFNIWRLAGLPKLLPEGTYRLEGERQTEADALGWALAHYSFDRYRGDPQALSPRCLLVSDEKLLERAVSEANAQALVRDLVNTPAEDMGPADLEAAARALGDEFGGTVAAITGASLLEKRFPMIHAVGRAAAPGREPRLIELNWGRESDPRIAIVGKGVCFDSGGLDVKSASGMRLMKKDMGGAAHALGLARLVMEAGLRVRLQLLIPAVENSVSGDALRPGDVVKTRKGLSVEIHNTDAEGRLVLCDALAYAEESDPDFVVDFATLTGAARVALGPDLPAMFARLDDTGEALVRSGTLREDPVWRLPLWENYLQMLNSDIADLSNAATGGFAGAVTAALYLSSFVDKSRDWVHLDTYAWMPANKPGRPKGGEALGLRATFQLIADRYATG